MKQIKTVLIASGSGTDAGAIMQAYRCGQIPEIDLCGLVSTKENAGCLEKAAAMDIPTVVFGNNSGKEFNRLLEIYLRSLGCQLVFLVGCIKKVQPFDGIAIYNIHPAALDDFGGKGMYGLAVHEKVISSVEDLIARGKRTELDRFFTFPTVHEVIGDYDSGTPLLVGRIEIPSIIIRDLISRRITREKAAEILQKVVLPYEWILLPTAVKMAAKKILDSQLESARAS